MESLERKSRSLNASNLGMQVIDLSLSEQIKKKTKKKCSNQKQVQQELGSSIEASQKYLVGFRKQNKRPKMTERKRKAPLIGIRY